MRPREMQGSELSEEKTRNYEPTTAYHEAGHAVAAAVLGVGFRYATMKPRHDADGSVHLRSSARRWTAKSCAVSLSGVIAETKYIVRDNGEPGEAVRDDLDTSASGDYDHVVLLAELEAAGPEHIQQRIDEGRELAESTVSLNWAAVEKVAARLIRAGRIDAAEVREIVANQT